MTEWNRNKESNKRIIELRKDGFSIKTIAKMVGRHQSIVSYHCDGVKISGDILKTKKGKESAICRRNASMASKCVREQWIKRRDDATKEAESEWPKIRNDPRMMGFLGLYWGEGGKRGHEIGIANYDPGVILAFIAMMNHFDVAVRDKSIHVMCYPTHDISNSKKFWEKCLKRPISIHQKEWWGTKKKTYSQYGTCYVRVSNWKIKQKILTWLECWRNDLFGSKIFGNRKLGIVS